ncbi:MAG: 23S rRNA pseudouridine [Geobacteraceae bacterium]|nr:MAG: 23S rRNA pseudouridine [Geobacteraceae bacterium]
MLTFTITASDHCRSVESFLRNLLPAAPISYLKKLIKSGHLAVNGASPLPGTILKLADTITLKESSKIRELLTGRRPEADILYEDQWIVVFNKPPDIPVHRAAEDEGRNMVQLGEKFLAERGMKADTDDRARTAAYKLRPVNRLDRGTSGAVIMAKSPTAAGMFGRLVKEEGLGKLYLAVMEGTPPDEGTITAPVEGKESETRYRLIFQGEEGALAAVYPVSGRMHQIRQHFKLIGHPVWGDRRYGGRPLPGFAGHALHSFRTTLTHPATGERLAIYAPLPEGIRSLISRLAGNTYAHVLQSLPDIPAEIIR